MLTRGAIPTRCQPRKHSIVAPCLPTSVPHPVSPLLPRLPPTVKVVWQKLVRRLGQIREQGHVHQPLALAAVAFVPQQALLDLLSNKVFMAGFWSFFVAQFSKIFSERWKKGRWDLAAVVAAGGMPSSHSSLCAGVTTALAVVQGLNSPLFAAATAFSLVVMYDAMGVRHHAGLHAQVLNKVVVQISDDGSLGRITDIQLKEVLGHTPRQVLCGGLLGIVIGLVYPLYF